MRLSELQTKEIIDIETGKRIGNIIDVYINTNGNIEKLVLEERRTIKINRNKEELSISWDKIVKIGDDIILISNKNKYLA